MAKYNTMGEVIQAFQSGDIDKTKWGIWMDSNHSSLHWIGDEPNDMRQLELEEWREDQDDVIGRRIFSGGEGRRDIIEIIEAIGITVEGV